jgi:hypothetical protein
LLKKYKIDESPDFSNGNYSLSLTVNEGDDSVIKFFREMEEFKFDQLRKVSIENIEDFNPLDIKVFNRFMKYWFPNSLSVLWLQSSMTNINLLISGLEIILERVHCQVYLQCFQFDQNTLKKVIESSRNAKELVFYWCQIDEISSEFELDPYIHYSLEVLDLYETAKKKEKKFLNKKKLKKLSKAMAKTNIKSNLRKVHVRAQFFKLEKVQKVFSKQGFIISVKANDKEPKIKS